MLVGSVLMIGVIPLREFGKRYALVLLFGLLLFAIFTYGLVTCGLIWSFIKAYSFILLIVIVALGALWISMRLKKRSEYP